MGMLVVLGTEMVIFSALDLLSGYWQLHLPCLMNDVIVCTKIALGATSVNQTRISFMELIHFTARSQWHTYYHATTIVNNENK